VTDSNNPSTDAVKLSAAYRKWADEDLVKKWLEATREFDCAYNDYGPKTEFFRSYGYIVIEKKNCLVTAARAVFDNLSGKCSSGYLLGWARFGSAISGYKYIAADMWVYLSPEDDMGQSVLSAQGSAEKLYSVMIAPRPAVTPTVQKQPDQPAVVSGAQVVDDELATSNTSSVKTVRPPGRPSSSEAIKATYNQMFDSKEITFGKRKMSAAIRQVRDAAKKASGLRDDSGLGDEAIRKVISKAFNASERLP